MPPREQSAENLVFGRFEVNLATAEVFRSGRKLRLSGQPAQVLVILLQHAGQLVTREELRLLLWPEETFVDFDHGLNNCINRIREVLGDSATAPRWIETLPKRGYRFVGKLEKVDAEAPQQGVAVLESLLPPSQASPVGATEKAIPEPRPETAAPLRTNPALHSRRTWLKFAAGIVAISFVASGAVAIYRWVPRQVLPEQGVLKASPFTALAGVETLPAFSPDGSRIAFAWNGDPASGGKGFDLYVKALGSETLLRLTQHPSELIGPAWSPDGTQIAFQRAAGADTGIYVVPALGGPERKIRSTYLPSLSLVPIDWSPDGKWIAFTDNLPGERTGTMSLLSTATWEVTRLPNPPKCSVEGTPAFSHRGDYLAYWCFQTEEEYGLYSVPLQGGQPKLIRAFHPFPTGLVWSGDDKSLIYSISGELSEVNLANGSIKRLDFAGGAVLPTVSTKGNMLAFSSGTGNENIWRRDLLHPESPPVELIPSTRTQEMAQYSPEGKRIVFESERSGVSGIWISSDDGSNLVRISNPQVESGSPQWSPDGKEIAFDSRPVDKWEIYVADVSERIPRKLVTNISDVTSPTWSRDGMWIYFMSHEVGRTGIYRCAARGGDADALSGDPRGIVAQESFDGKTAYFANHEDTPKLKQVSLQALPGTAIEVDGLPRVRRAEHWTVTSGGIYFVPADAPRSLRYFEFSTRHARKIFDMEKDFGSGLSVSPDGRWVIYAQNDDVNGDIVLVDNFR